MTPEEWERCADPAPLLGLLRGKADDRALRRFACACVRRVWGLLSEEASRAAVAVAERHADGLAGADELRDAFAAAPQVAPPADEDAEWWTVATAAPSQQARRSAAYAALDASAPGPWGGALHGFPDAWAADAAAWAAAACTAGAAMRAAWAGARVGERAAQAALVRCILRSPFRPVVPLDPAVLVWDGGAARRLAEAIYAGRRFGDLPILADLLEEAGLTDAALLGHLRGPELHVLGCWALDAVLGKS
jgi:hypothetical protein